MAKVTKRKTTKTVKAAAKKGKPAIKRKVAARTSNSLSFNIKGAMLKGLIEKHGSARAAKAAVMKSVENLGTANG